MMSLFQRALETYDVLAAHAGIYDANEEEPLAPVSHIIAKVNIIITIDADGKLSAIRRAVKKQKIVIPATEDSASRTRAPAAHPLCEQLGYLLTDDREKHFLYMHELSAWAESEYSHPKVRAVYRYMERGTLRADLYAAGLGAAGAKELVCWCVIGLGMASGPVWMDVSLMKAYSTYYLSTLQEREQQRCMLTGEMCPATRKHLKGVFALHGNAKLISANDSDGFTFRGRFAEPEEAAAMGYVASQKVHNAIKWLISGHGSVQGNRAFVCWASNGSKVPHVTENVRWQEDDDSPDYTFAEYREDLRSRLEDYRGQWRWSDRVVIAAFDAANDGRLAVTYYSELLGTDFLDRLEAWEEGCCWWNSRWGIFSPTLHQIVAYAYGMPHRKDAEPALDRRLIAHQMQRLIACRIDQLPLPLDIMQAIVTRASNLQNYEKDRSKLLFTACAVIRKYHIDHMKGEIPLALETERKDRSYQWGRLLAVMERIEETACWNKEQPSEKDNAKVRLTMAIRMQTAFIQRPAVTAASISEHLHTTYYQELRVRQRNFFDRLIGEIMEQLSWFDPAEYGTPLSETYLPGYYLQKNAFYTYRCAEEMNGFSSEYAR